MALKTITGTLTGCVLMFLFTLPPHGGFMLFVFLLVLVPLSLHSVFVMFRNKGERKLRATKLSIWVVAVLFVIGVNYYRHINTRETADNIVAAIAQYKSETGDYPKSVEAIGMSQQALRDKLGLSAYSQNEGKPRFYYAVTYIVFDTYDYDFELGEWQYPHPGE